MEAGILGSRIRRERKALGLTLEKFAELVRTSKAMLQRVETGAKSPSIALLAEIATVCRRRMDDFIHEEPAGFYRLDETKQKTIHLGNCEVRIIAPFGLVSKDIVVNHFKAKAGAVVKPHKENGHAWVYITAGRCVFEHGGIPHRLKKGDVIYYDARKSTTLKVLTRLESIRITVRGG
jgi:transcriptional regulator with XRE-family HTH domain